MDKEQQPFDVFISHSSKDSLKASAMKQALQNKGIRCWKAPDDILPGESWPTAIMRALSRCRVMVLVWTSNSMTSVEVYKELTLAMRNRLTVVPFRIDNIDPVGDWEYHLANTHWLDASDGLAEKHFEFLGDFLLKMLPSRVDTTVSVEPGIPLPDLELLIDHALEDGVLTEQERTLLLRDAVALGRDREEFKWELDSRLAERKQESAESVPDIRPGVVPTASPPQLPVSIVAASVHFAEDPVSASTFSNVPSVPMLVNRGIGKLVLWGSVWSVIFFSVGFILVIFYLIIFVDGKSEGEGAYHVLVGFFMITMHAMLSLLISIWLTITGKLPGTRKNSSLLTESLP